MSVNVHAISHSSLAVKRSVISTTAVMPFAASVGFYFSFRLFFPLLAVRIFGQDAQYGVIVSLALNYLLLCLAALGAVGAAPSALKSVSRLPSFRWVLLFFGFSGISLLWSVTASLPA